MSESFAVLQQLAASVLVLLPAAEPPCTGDGPASATTAMALEMHCPLVTLTVRSASGRERPTRFAVATGGGALLLSDAVVTELGLVVRRAEAHEEARGLRFAGVETPRIALDGFELDLQGAQCVAVLDRATVLPGGTAEALLPGHVLARHHVVLDYPAGRFTLARPGALEPVGTPVPSPSAERSGFLRLELLAGGQALGFVLDTGAPFTLVSQAQLERWQQAHPDLAAMTGAIGEANIEGAAAEAAALVMRLPPLSLGPLQLDGLLGVSRPTASVETFLSARTTAPVVGVLGANVLRHFRVELDYASGTTWLQAATDDVSTHLDAVGLVLVQAPDGGHAVGAVAHAGGRPLCEGVLAGDVVVAVDGRPVTELAHRQLIDLLRGEPGSLRNLSLLRDGEPRECAVRVLRALEPEGAATR